MCTAEESVDAPPDQVALKGDDYPLRCGVSALPGTSTLFRGPQNQIIPSGIVTDVGFEAEGAYRCVVIEPATGGSTIYTTTITLQVVGKIALALYNVIL